MLLRGRYPRVALLLVISLAATLTITSPAGALSVRDSNYNGIWQDWGGGWQYIYWSASDYAAWKLNGKTRLAYEYTNQQWWDCDKFSSWRKIGATGVGDWWIGDGGWHNLKNGWSYSFISSADFSTWAVNGVLARFLYEYGKGQWWDYGTGWNKIGAVDVSASFVGDGAWHSLNNGWTYSYNSSADLSAWADNGLARFLYEYGKGQWWDYGTNWYAMGLTNVSSAFIGDGTWHSLNNGWSYSYNAAGDLSTWKYSGSERFRYNYVSGVWSDFSSYNGGVWNAISGTGASSAFIGDNVWHSLNNGWSYAYNASADSSAWKYTDRLRFGYNYRDGQWFDTGACNAGAWNALSGTGISSSFLGDGGWHDISRAGGKTWWYLYAAADDEASWARSNGGANQFSYQYAPGYWYHYAAFGGKVGLGQGIALSSSFMGDGLWHGLHKFGARYFYDYDANEARFAMADTVVSLFSYTYDTGQWYHHDFLTRYALGATGAALSSFIGDGAAHDLGNGWFYTYISQEGLWSRTAAGQFRFGYNYTSGQWYHYDQWNRYALGRSMRLASFMGDEAWHGVQTRDGKLWYYIYSYANDEGSWATGGPPRFSYKYATATWYDRPSFSESYQLGSAGVAAEFIADGQWHDLLNGWRYKFGYDENDGYWATPLTGVTRLSFDYDLGQWYQHDALNRYALGMGSQTAGVFLGDGLRHNVTLTGGDTWWFEYNKGEDKASWFKSATGNTKFAYSYSTGIWTDTPLYGTSYSLGVNGRSAEFIGDGTRHDLGNGWWYAFAYGTDVASWAQTSTSPTRFSYAYNTGQWYHHDGTTGYTLGVAQKNAADFVGNGVVHDIYWSGNYHWLYQYVYGSDSSTWARPTTGSTRFTYRYGTGQWLHHDSTGGYLMGTAAPDVLADTNLHDVVLNGHTWKYRYDYDVDTEYWRLPSGAERFRYAFGTSRWYQGGYQLGPDGVSVSELMLDGSSHSVGVSNPWWFTYDYGTDTASWAKGQSDPARFSYNYLATAWTDYALSGAYQLGTAGLSASFIGDGYDHTIGNGWNYAYIYDANEGVRKRGSTRIFSYDYDDRQWYHWDTYANRYALGEDNWAASDFIGDGNRRNITLDGGKTWWFSFDATNTLSRWFRSDSDADKRFDYAYLSATWRHFGTYSPSGVVLKTSGTADFFGDGFYHGITASNPWSYSYDYDNDRGLYSKDGGVNMRFAYNYTPGTWRDNAPSGEYQLGIAGLDANFRGDGIARTLGNGWNYIFQYNPEEGIWKRPSDSRTIFSYVYGASQWYHHYGNTTRVAVGPNTMAAAEFLGDGNRHNITLVGGKTWWYSYDSANTLGRWFRADNDADKRFDYAYLSATWRHFGLYSPSGVVLRSGSADFVGDGTYRSIPTSNAWSYAYDHDNDRGLYSKDGVNIRFAYQYLGGSWWDNAPSGEYQLGLIGLDANFRGDGTARTLGNGWNYIFQYNPEEGIWKRPSDSRTIFSYVYGASQWYHHYDNTTRVALGPNTLAAADFLGDGFRHNITLAGGKTWWYSYDSANTLGRWFRADNDADKRFDYAYLTSTWRHFGLYSPSGVVLKSGGTADFFGDGFYHGITASNPWSYAYDHDNDRGLYSKDGVNIRFSYQYMGGSWWDNAPSGEYQLGLIGLDANFRGDGTARTLGNGWNYVFQYNPEEGIWQRPSDSRNILAYVYGARQWYHYQNNSTRYALGPDNWAASEFMCDGLRHNVTLSGGNTWWYAYDFGSSAGYWFKSDNDADKRFGYAYTGSYGTWSHFGPFTPTGATLTSLNIGEGFIGDGVSRTVGNNLQYRYDYTPDEGIWRTSSGSIDRFVYQYVPGQWKHIYNIVRYDLGAAGASASDAFWDGNEHLLNIGGDNWYYKYGTSYTNDMSQYRFQGTSAPQFGYSYSSGAWFLVQNGSFRLMTDTRPPSEFFGDGAYHDANSSHYIKFKYDKATNRFLVDKVSTGSPGALGWFYYDFTSQIWLDYYTINNTYHLMSGWTLENVGSAILQFRKTGIAGYYNINFLNGMLGDYADGSLRDYDYITGRWLSPDEAGPPDLYRP